MLLAQPRLVVAQQAADDPAAVLAHVAILEIEDFGWVVRGREEAPVTDYTDEGCKGVGDPAEGEADGGEGAAGGGGEGLLDDVGADYEKDGEHVAGVGPLERELVGGAAGCCRCRLADGSFCEVGHVHVGGGSEAGDRVEDGHGGRHCDAIISSQKSELVSLRSTYDD